MRFQPSAVSHQLLLSPSVPPCLRAFVPSCLSLPSVPIPSGSVASSRFTETRTFAKPQVRLAVKKRRCASPAKREDIRAPRLPSSSWLIPHGSSLPSPLRPLRIGGESLPCAHVRGAESFTSAQNSQKKSRLASRQTAFGGPTCHMHLPSARRGGRGSFYRRSCSCVFTSSTSTSQFPGAGAGAGARRLWRELGRAL